MTKPYDLDVLYARILAHLQREDLALKPKFSVGNIRIDVTRQSAYLGDVDALLKPKEFSLLLYLYQNANTVLSDTEIYHAVWGRDAAGDTRTVRVHIHSLRKKLLLDMGANPWIETVQQMGYCFRTN